MTNFDRVFVRLSLMERMIAALGLAGVSTEIPVNVRQNAEVRCGTCTRGADCADWLNAHPVAAGAPDYCRNRTLFARLVRKFEDAWQ